MIMHNSHLQTEICIEGAFKKSKTSVRVLMIIIIIVIAKKSFGDAIRLKEREPVTSVASAFGLEDACRGGPVWLA